jgi:thiol-disulfide isomerase/thioredoxin
MPSFINSISRRLSRYYITVLFVVIFVIFVVFSVYSYKWFYLPYIKRQTIDDISNKSPGGAADSSDSVVLYFFHVDWCKYCVTALPEWTSFSQITNGKTINGKVVNCVDINMTDTSSDSGVDEALRSKYNVKSFPTVQLVRANGDVAVLDAKPTQQSLTEFVNKMV